METGMSERFRVEPEYELDEGCKCLSCWEPTGAWLVQDMKDLVKDEIYPSEEQANKRCKELNNAQKTDGSNP